MQRISVGVSQVFHICWTIFFGLLFPLILIRIPTHSLLKILPFLVFPILLSVYRRFRPGLETVSDSLFRAVLCVFLTAEAVLFCYTAWEICVVPFTDTGVIWFSAADITETGTLSPVFDEYCKLVGAHSSRQEYFFIYPNSRFMVSFLLPYCRLLHNIFGVDLRSMTGYYCAACLNIVFLLLTELFVVLTARRAGGKGCGFLAMLFCLGFFPYALHAFKLYSDTLSMPFVILSVWLVLCSDTAVRHGRSYLILLLAGLSTGFGTLLKGSVLILALAAVLYLLFTGTERRRKLVRTASFAATFLTVFGLWQLRSEQLPWLDTAEADRYELPSIHWFMMASQGDGGFVLEDYEYSLSFDTLAKRRAADRAEYLRRVREQGMVGYLKHCAGKISSALSDGLFFQRNHFPYLKETRLYRFLHSRSLQGCFSLFACLFYIGILLSGWLGIRRDNGILFLCNICFFGVLLFFAFWECKSRYLLNFTPLFLFSTVLVIDRFSKLKREDLLKLKRKQKQI